MSGKRKGLAAVGIGRVGAVLMFADLFVLALPGLSVLVLLVLVGNVGAGCYGMV